MILILGAAGILGSTLLTVLGPDQALAAIRTTDNVDPCFKTVVLDNGSIARDFDWSGIVGVINAAGKTNGSEDELWKANVELPATVAKQAYANGVERFVQVSSFSIFGDVDIITCSTPIQPNNAYGRSKASAEKLLEEMVDERFKVISIRIPFMFNALNPGLLGNLINVARILHVMPSGRGGIARSVLSYENAARILHAAAQGRINQTGCAAENQYFHFDDLADIMRQEYNCRIWSIRLPQLVDKTLGTLTPKLHRRLLRSNVLQAEANLARNLIGLQHLDISLRSVVHTMLRTM